ncbi:hypothetical protein N0V88_005539 [Collariella sp. IMI 366227]|nr:hypothetical protein N0V88_005539 [Collariella sp. IMI 366227]
MLEPDMAHNILSGSHTSLSNLIDPRLLHEVAQKQETGTRHLLCTRGSNMFDPTAGRLRFFGPTANIHVHAKSSCPLAPQERTDQVRRAEHLITSLRPATHDHLMRCFWDYYNSWQQVVDEAAFEVGRATQDPRFYSLFLHLVILAVGYRFADWERDDVKRMLFGNRESTLHREAKSLMEIELERPGGIPSVQALLMLADLECGVGRDATGWMYAGMANRLAFDIGLHITPDQANFSELEQQTRRQTRRQAITACVMFDRKWALLLGRPTQVKIHDIGADVLPQVPADPLPETIIGTIPSNASINRQIFELLELAGRVADFQNSIFGAAHIFATKAVEDRAYLYFVGLERLFHGWYRRLPENLTWKPANIKTAPLGFFMLHQQFHVCMILLHRPWAKYGPMPGDGTTAARYPSPQSPGQEDGAGGFPSWMSPLSPHDSRTSMSRSMCTQHAIRVARIFWHNRQRFDGRRIGITAIQHAGTAALALLAALAHKSAELDQQSTLRYLQVLSTAIYDMSHLYQPAARMYQLLKAMLVDIRAEMVKSGGLQVSSFGGQYPGSAGPPSRSNSWSPANGVTLANIHPEDDRLAKRRRLSSLSSMDLTSFSPSLFSSSHQTLATPSESPHQDVNADSTPGEANTFNLDFFHATFVDFINQGGDGPGSQNWGAEPDPVMGPRQEVAGEVDTVTTKPPPAPMTPVTLDELVQSVEVV